MLKMDEKNQLRSTVEEIDGKKGNEGLPWMPIYEKVKSGRVLVNGTSDAGL